MRGGWIKICGVRDLGELEACLEAAPDAVGLNLVPGSRRRVDLETARELRAALRGRAEAVGVFVDAGAEQLREVQRALELDWLQLHGSESEELIEALEAEGHRVLRACRPGSADARALEALARLPARRLLIDAPGPEAGGTGRPAHREAARRLAREWPVILAGGLRPENVAEAIRAVRPAGVDVASGVEGEDGRKDPRKVRAFVERAREALG
ncbi:MAG: phosphoribosylanthranilate isomerase [Deltaproteobacteria bacterium]|nr:phosphoribosylanthranilate isomerase [Deltaproteobacteria bacterium]